MNEFQNFKIVIKIKIKSIKLLICLQLYNSYIIEIDIKEN